MFRLSHYMNQLVRPRQSRRRTAPIRPVVIWNLTRRCNLKCRHCYAVAADHHFPGELTTAEAIAVLDDLAAFGIPASDPLRRRTAVPSRHARSRAARQSARPLHRAVDQRHADRRRGRRRNRRDRFRLRRHQSRRHRCDERLVPRAGGRIRRRRSPASEHARRAASRSACASR